MLPSLTSPDPAGLPSAHTRTHTLDADCLHVIGRVISAPCLLLSPSSLEDCVTMRECVCVCLCAFKGVCE